MGGDRSVATYQEINFFFQVKNGRRKFVDVSLKRVNDVSVDRNLSIVFDGSGFGVFHGVEHFVQTIFQLSDPI